MNYIKLFPCFILFLCLSCEADSYEKGEGKYSLMQADMADITIDSRQQAVSFVTDDDDSYQLVNPFTAKWIQTADTTYRTIIYYNKVDDRSAEVVSAGTVVTLNPMPH